MAPVSSPPSATSTGSVRLRLNPTNAQAAVLVRAAGARRFAFNWDLAQIKANQDQRAGEATYDIPRMDRTRPFSYFDLVRRWHAVKHAAPWHVEQLVWTFRYGIRAAHVAHSRFLKRQSRFSRFKARHRDRPRFTTADGLRLQPGRLRVAKYGCVALAVPCRAQAQLRRLLVRGRARILNITVSRDAGGCWYASVCFERTATAAPQGFNRPSGAAAGVDVGVTTAAVVATAGGTLWRPWKPPVAPRDALTHLKHLQRALSRTQKGSANRAKARLRLGRAHARVGAARASRLRQFTAALAKVHRMGEVENIATANLMRNPHLAQGHRRPGLGRAGPPARLQDHQGRRHPGGSRPPVPLKQDVLGMWCGETQAAPGRAHLPMRRMHPGRRTGPERRRKPRRVGRAATGHPPGCWYPRRGPPPGRPVSSAC